jgi:hypothetical protein
MKGHHQVAADNVEPLRVSPSNHERPLTVRQAEDEQPEAI